MHLLIRDVYSTRHPSDKMVRSIDKESLIKLNDLTHPLIYTGQKGIMVKLLSLDSIEWYSGNRNLCRLPLGQYIH